MSQVDLVKELDILHNNEKYFSIIVLTMILKQGNDDMNLEQESSFVNALEKFMEIPELEPTQTEIDTFPVEPLAHMVIGVDTINSFKKDLIISLSEKGAPDTEGLTRESLDKLLLIYGSLEDEMKKAAKEVAEFIRNKPESDINEVRSCITKVMGEMTEKCKEIIPKKINHAHGSSMRH